MGTVIKAENLGKSYLIGHQRESYYALRDVLVNKARQAVINTKKFFSGGQLVDGNEIEEFWALKDVSFEVQQGDRLGIIGRNGAGKSTLLKVLSRITEPTTGRLSMKGRVASLLEVGTGFHPELTGRENIFLNGAILGMSRVEVRKKFDEIVDFSGVEKFLDTPVKRYSSGMYVRLAFAVAAHLEPEILIIDEVLAVGDAEFQKKCLGKMEDVSKNEGRTVLFVSHNMQAISNLCSRAILIQNGRIIQDDNALKVVSLYLMNSGGNSGEIIFNDAYTLGDSTFKMKAIRVLDQNNTIENSFLSKSKIRIQFDFELYKLDDSLVIGFDLMDENGIVMLRTYHTDGYSMNWPKLTIGKNKISCDLPGELLNNGTYFICPKVSLHCTKWIINSGPLLSFNVELNHGISPFWNIVDKFNKPGLLALILPWRASK